MRDQEKDWIRAALASGNFEPTEHAAERMMSRNVSKADIQSVGHTCTEPYAQPENPGSYRVDGLGLDGEKLSIICAYGGGTLIITVLDNE